MTAKTGKQYDAYLDGKCSLSRLVRVVVDAVVPITELNKTALRMWKRAINKDFNDSLIDGFIHYMHGPQRFWDWNCDTFIVGHILNDKQTTKDPMLFAKRPHGWYCLNWNYSLDVDGSVRRKYRKMWKECAKELHTRMRWNRKSGRYDYYDISSGENVTSQMP